MSNEKYEIKMYEDVDGDLHRQVWRLYYTAFGETNLMAVQSHIMSFESFKDMCKDSKVQKWIVRDKATREPVGMSVITNWLSAWPFVSDEYFAAKYPKLYAENRIFYIGFVCVAERERRLPDLNGETKNYKVRYPGVFEMLVHGMLPQIQKANGLAFLDYCNAIVEKGLPIATQNLLKKADPSMTAAVEDVQQFWRYDFSGGQR